MLTGKHWPVHPHPYPNELLSSWLVRIAHAHGCKLQTFCHHAFKDNPELWNRDIDRLAPEWLLNKISQATGLSFVEIQNTTLRKFEGELYPRYHASGLLNWVIPLNLYHRKRLGYGLQFCPLCLVQDHEPYFRLTWSLALQTFCPDHLVSMLDRCPHCESPIIFHRQELGQPDKYKTNTLSECWSCQFDLRHAPPQPSRLIEDESCQAWHHLLKRYSGMVVPQDLMFDFKYLAVLRHLAVLITHTKLAPKLQHYLCQRTGLVEMPFFQGKALFERRSTSERHQALLLAWWLLGDWPHRLYRAWSSKSIQYNFLLKDLAHSHTAFRDFVSTLNRNIYKSLYRIDSHE